MNVYLDDMRPVPDGWVLCQTIDQVKEYLTQGNVIHLSLDHDLGACDACMIGPHGDPMTSEEWLDYTDFQSMPNCAHFGTGYDLVCWMEEHGIWSAEKPTVHSANPTGSKRMRDVIERNWNAIRLMLQEHPDKNLNEWRCATPESRLYYIREAND